MAFSHENSGPPWSCLISRRSFLRISLSGFLFPPIFLFPVESLAESVAAKDLLGKYLGEQLGYQIGFWLFSHCGEASITLCRSPTKGIYVASMKGRTTGFVDWLLGRYRYSYTSYAGYDEKDDRLVPFYFKLKKKRKNRVSTRSVTFDYKDKELIFARQTANGEQEHKIISMKKDVTYEDYLTLFYNFRHGHYGSLQRGKTYHLPLYIHEGFDYLDLTVASEQEEADARAQELNPKGKDYFVRFRVLKEDVSSKSGKIIGWISKDGVPTKGVIKDVIFFGDLWGVLVKRELGKIVCKKNVLA